LQVWHPHSTTLHCVESVYCVSADDKRSDCAEEETGHRCCGASGDVGETGVLREVRGGLLELLIVEGQEGGARLRDASAIRSVNRKVSDDVACDLVSLIQYLLTFQYLCLAVRPFVSPGA
jgi:hypothetical protein